MAAAHIKEKRYRFAHDQPAGEEEEEEEDDSFVLSLVFSLVFFSQLR